MEEIQSVQNAIDHLVKENQLSDLASQVQGMQINPPLQLSNRHTHVFVTHEDAQHSYGPILDPIPTFNRATGRGPDDRPVVQYRPNESLIEQQKRQADLKPLLDLNTRKFRRN